MIISILQPGFLPWLGFFEQMLAADRFVYMDDVQYTRKDWRNRNRFKSPHGVKMISIPVRKGSSRQKMMIKDARINNDHPWQKDMLKKIEDWYKKALFFDDIYSELEKKMRHHYRYLIDLDTDLIEIMRDFLNITTPFFFSSGVPRAVDEKNLRIIEICKFHGADILYDGKSAADFIDTRLFTENGISVVFQDYVHPRYPQLWGEFVSHLSALDLIMNCGGDSGDILGASVCQKLRPDGIERRK